MRIGLVPNSLPDSRHTGDSAVVQDLAWGLRQLGHDVFVSLGADWGPAEYRLDIVHDFGEEKFHAEAMAARKLPFIATLLGGNGYRPMSNTVVWSNAMRDRVLRGQTDYENTPTPEAGGPPCEPFKDVRVVYGGVDTEFYSPGGEPEEFFLWLSRWHDAKGFKQAIYFAKETGFPVVLAGARPDYDHPYQAERALEAVELIRGCGNIQIEFLPPDPSHHDAKRGLLRRAKAFLNCAQFQEPFGLGQIEAMACGTPVIAHDIGSSSELVDHDMTGFLYKNLEQMVSAAHDIDIIDRNNCRTKAVERFDRLVMATNYLKEYERIVSGEGWGP